MQQAKAYADCERYEVKYVFSTNGHRYGEYDCFTRLQAGPFQFLDFPTHPELTTRYAKDSGIDLYAPDAAMLFQADSPAWAQSRYYQDAAMRAAFEKIIIYRKSGKAPRVLLTLATGAGKTIIATNLLWRLSQAGLLPKPALFPCDRDELREQAYSKLKAAFGDNARIVKTERGGNAAQNARIHIATYQTLGLDDDGFSHASRAPYRWQDWAAPWSDKPGHSKTPKGKPFGWKRQELFAAGDGNLFDFINKELLPALHGLDIDARTGLPNPTASPKQRIIGRIMTAVEKVRVDSETNLRDIPAELAPKGTCALVLDEGMLFRTNESSFVETKRKLVDECDLWAIVSLPGGVFSTAGAGVKTNLLFFTKGKKIERIFDLKAVNPSAVAKFDDRSPAEIIQSIHDQGRIVAEALARLGALVGEDERAEPDIRAVQS